MPRFRLKATVTIIQEYWAETDDYGGCITAAEMVRIDKDNFDNDPLMFIDGMMDTGEMKIKITRVKDKK